MAIQKITSGIIADGAILATDIADGIVTNAKLAGSITSDKITSVSNTAIAGLIQAAQIGSVSNTALSGVIEVAQLADTLNLASKTVTLPAGVGGKVLQVVSTTKTDTFTSTSTSYVDITGLSLNITPLNINNKIMLIASIATVEANSNNLFLRFLRNSTAIGVGASEGNRIQATSGTRIPTADNGSINSVTMNFYDSPATTSALTYKIQMALQAGTGLINRSGDDLNITGRGRYISTITAMEIAA